MAQIFSRGRAWIPPGGGETVRAFAIFAALLAGLVWTAHAASLGDVRRLAVQIELQKGTREARHVADAIAALGRGPTGIDFYRIQQNRPMITGWIQDRLARQPDFSWVEIRDRFQIPIAQVRSSLAAAHAATLSAEYTLVVAGIPQGDVRVGISTDAIDRDIERLQRSLRNKVISVAAIGAILLVLGFAYVLHLIRKNRALERARQSTARAAFRGVVGSGLAHEIRNPLNSMNMNLQMLEEELQGVPGLEGGEHVEMLRSMQGEIKRIKNLIDNFLQYARPAPAQFEVKSLNDALTTIARFLQADFRRSGVDLALDLEPLLPTVEFDEAQIRQALLNILGNARQVVAEGGHVRLTSRAGSGGEVLVEVADDGPGIPPDMLDRIFEPFFSKRAGGTGLGLAIARQMIETHGGRIEVESHLGRGTTFRIRLPRRHDAAASVTPGRAR
ncbi:MAG TPA: ATP-binding protein [Candidatus Polarisedimenticolaceae bacterium]|nr:ATP-binding protein [Candidatus Polarisedimenticolaceae bacterium]